MNEKRYKDDIAMTCHETATTLFEIDVIKETTMRKFDEDCLVPDNSPSLELVKRGRVKPEPAYAHT
jgi:DNA-binding transcriptional regulator YiaG